MSDKRKIEPKQVPYLVGFPDLDGKNGADMSDYRPVPSSDRGNDGYHDRGMLGSYATNDGEPWPSPAGVERFTGFGANEADLVRGFCEPGITQNPAYQLENYKDRSSQPMESDVTPGNIEAMEDDWNFRNRNRKSRGFLTRPRIPTER